MAETVLPDASAAPSGSRIFLRLLRLLRPHWGMIGFGLLLLIISTPCELFPALVWLYVTDDLIGTGHGRPTPVLAKLISLDGHIHAKIALLWSSMVWLFVVYLIGEGLGTLSTNVMN